jgi:hypothetical protein
MSSLLIFQLAQPLNNIWTKITSHFTIITYAISIGLNVILTCGIVFRLLSARHWLQRSGLGHEGQVYVSISAMLIESAALYAVVGVAFLIAFGVGSWVQDFFIAVLAPAQAIAPTLIIMRVAQGRAWSRDTLSNSTSGGIGARQGRSDVQMSTLRFNAHSASTGTTQADGSFGSTPTTVLHIGQGSEGYSQDGKLKASLAV